MEPQLTGDTFIRDLAAKAEVAGFDALRRVFLGAPFIPAVSTS